MLLKHDPDWQQDLLRLGMARPFLKEQSIWAIWVYRYGRRVDALPHGLGKRIRTQLYWLMFRFVETWTGISLPKEAVIGGGLRIFHFGGIFIHPGVRMGRACTSRQGVTIGNKTEGGPVPVLEDDVELGAYAQALGGGMSLNRSRMSEPEEGADTRSESRRNLAISRFPMWRHP